MVYRVLTYDDFEKVLAILRLHYKKDIYFKTQALMPVYKINVFFSLMI